MRRVIRAVEIVVAVALVCACGAAASASEVSGSVRDESGGALPGVSVDLRSGAAPVRTAITDAQGVYRFDGVEPGRYQILFTLINFAAVRREIEVGGPIRVDVVMQLALNADVTVTGKRTFANLADVENPAENLVGIAQSASQGAVTAMPRFGRRLRCQPHVRAA